MRKKTLTAVILAAALTLGNSMAGFAALKVAQSSEISSNIGDPRGNNPFYDIFAEILFEYFDPVSGLIPVRIGPFGHGFINVEDSILFFNTAGQTVIPANNNWELSCGFKNGQALVKEKNTGNFIVLNPSGEEIGRIVPKEDCQTPYVLPLPAKSQYQYRFISGRAGDELSPPLNLKVIFATTNGEQKVVDLQEKYWSIGEIYDNGYSPLFKRTGSYYIISSLGGGVRIEHYIMEQEDYIDENGIIYAGPMPGYQKNQDSNVNDSVSLPFDKEKNAYIGSIYEIQKIRKESYGDIYEIYDKAGNGTGIELYSIAGACEQFIIARPHDPSCFVDFNSESILPPYYIYYISEE